MDSSTLARAMAKALVGAAFAIIALGCGEPAAGDPAYKNGDLGKGGFLFGCADGVACRTFSGDAAKFPKKVASGSTFAVRFVANEDMGGGNIVDFDTSDTEYNGTHVEGVAPFFTRAPGIGIAAATRPGIGTLVARTSDGTVIDVTALTIVKPAKLVVYEADATSATTSVTTLSLSAKDSVGKRLRIVAQNAASDILAGSITHAWTFDPPNIARVDRKDDGVSTFVGLKAGTTTATVTGAALTATVTVEVKP